MHTHMPQLKSTVSIVSLCSLLFASLGTHGQTMAQGEYKQPANADTTAEFKPHGQLWGVAFGDYAYKENADVLNRRRHQPVHRCTCKHQSFPMEAYIPRLFL